MSEVFALRQKADALRLELENARAVDGSREVELQMVHKGVEAKTFKAPHGHEPEEWLRLKREESDERRQALAELEGELEETTQALGAALDAQKALFRQHNAEPIALLPVRLETRFAEASTILVRVFPDDLHIDAFDSRLTPAELKAAEAYWRKPGDESWRRLLQRLGPPRAAWAKRATRPRAPKKPGRRKAGERRLPEVTTLPSRWRFLGLVGGEVAVDTHGEDIPNPLPLGMLAPGPDGGEREQAEWLIDFKAAVKVGMAATLTLKPGVGHLDQLFAIGVQQSPASESSRHLRNTLMGHAFGAGLAFLPPGTPTNNTPESRTTWFSHPASKRPRLQRLKAESDGARLAKALGLPEPGFLGDCAGARDMTEQAVAGLTLLSWGALGRGIVDGAHGNDVFDDHDLPVDLKAWRGVRDHLVGNVRSRGPLPTIRVGNQPYGVLPVTSVDEWVPGEREGPTSVVASWVLRLRHHWRAALAPDWVPRVSDAAPADRVAAAILSRLPVAVDLAARRMLSPRATQEKLLKDDSPGPLISVGGVTAGANRRWTMPTEQASNLSFTSNKTDPDYKLVGSRLDPKPGEYTAVLSASRELLADALAVVRGKLSAADYEKHWPLDVARRKGKVPPRRDTIFAIVSEDKHPGLIPALLHPDNWIMWNGDLGPRDPLQAAINLPAAVDELVTFELGPAAAVDKEVRDSALASAKSGARQAPQLLHALAALEATPSQRLIPLALEVLDVYSHRLDAWITSLATRRLHALRHTKAATQSRLGGYGWVENLHPDPADADTDVDGYVHAPSLQHAATAAVLRSGFRAHHGEETLAVDLRSRRARIGRWLLSGVRRGQDLGSLLGYRFERALHDSGHDAMIADFRKRYPLQLAPEPQDAAENEDLWKRSSEAIAARNVVDGMALARDGFTVAGDKAAAEAKFHEAAPMVADLVGALDAVSDLLLAESVHHLVGGNPLRAGLAADTLGRGEGVPERFDVLRTPNRGRALTHCVAAILPPAPTVASGWTRDALAKLDPRVEAWVADALGPASELRLTGTLEHPPAAGEEGGGVEEKFEVGVEALGFGALATALAVSSADTTRLSERVVELTKAPGATVHYGGDGWRALRGVATRVRSLLASAQPLLPAHLVAGPAAADVVPDLEELRGRVKAFASPLPDSGKKRGTAAGRLARLAGQTKPPLDQDWLKGVATALAEVLGANVPVLPLLKGAKLGPVPAEAGEAKLADWLRRTGSVRPAVRTWQELLLLTGASSGRAASLGASQSPLLKAEESWIGGRFPRTERPAARQQVVYHAPSKLAGGAALAGIVFDEWVEVLPGSDALAATKVEGKAPVPVESELTGVSFHFDRPDAKAPQAILLAVPPDPKRGWTGDTLALAVRDTLELAKLRAVDLGDLPLLENMLPATRLNGQSPLGVLAFDFWKDLAE